MHGVEHFHERGFAIVRQALDPSVIAEVHRFLAAAAARTDALLARHGVAAGAPPDACHPQEVRSVLAGHFPLEVRLDQRLWAIPALPGFQAAARRAIGEERVFMHLPPTARFVRPGNRQAAVPPHQDAGYNGHLERFVVCWVPLVAINGDCGGVGVFEGSHGSPIAPAGTGEGFWLEGVDCGNHPLRHCQPMAPGDLLLLSSSIIHQSQPNHSDQTRISIDFRLFGASCRSAKHSLDLQTMTPLAPEADTPCTR